MKILTCTPDVLVIRYVACCPGLLTGLHWTHFDTAYNQQNGLSLQLNTFVQSS